MKKATLWIGLGISVVFAAPFAILAAYSAADVAARHKSERIAAQARNWSDETVLRNLKSEDFDIRQQAMIEAERRGLKA